MPIARSMGRALRDAANVVMPRKERDASRVRHRWMRWLGVLACATTAPGVHAQTSGGTIDPYEDFGRHLRAAQEVTPLKSDLFGDQTTLYNGETEFNVVDIDLPGNSALPVQLRRRLLIDDRRVDPGRLSGMDDWDVDVPYIEGAFDQQDGWVVQDSAGNSTTARCSNPTLPYVTYAGQPGVSDNFWSQQMWDGNFVHIPGSTDEEMLVNTEAKLPAVTDGHTYPWVTKSYYRFGCLPSANGMAGESFYALSPNGLKYTFNWTVSRVAPTMGFKTGDQRQPPAVTYPRNRIFLLATRVEDRFGNWVAYTYNNDQLTSITANDGREIDLTWSGNTVSSAKAGNRTWTYGYANSALISVVQPDSSQWTYTIVSGSLATTKGAPGEPGKPNGCQSDQNIFPNTGSFVYVINAPSGATGTFSFQYARHYRDYVPYSCADGNPDHGYPAVYAFFDNFTIVSKQIAGAGLAPMNWNYAYDDSASGAGSYFTASAPYNGNVETYIPTGYCGNVCAVSRNVTVTGPTDIVKYTFGSQYGVNEGWLLQTETDSPSGQIAKTVTNTYLTEDQVASQAFPPNVGQSVLPNYKNPMVNRIRPVTTTTITQDGDTYTHASTGFNAFAQVTETQRFNSITGQAAIDESTNYLNDTNLWVLDLPQQVVNNTNSGEVESTNVYNANDTLQSRAKFGQTLVSYGYDSTGNVTSVTDGDNHTTNLTNYKRGIAQSLAYPDTTTQTLVVDDYGNITSVTDQLGNATQYAYDGMDRMVQIAYPTGDEVAWYPKTFTYSFVTSAERGIPANHWRRTIATGSNVATTYFDAMLRPLLSDTGIGSSTVSSTLANYDANGQTVFASYPAATALSFTTTPDSAGITGTATTYDALERETQSQRDSELGTLTTTTAYLAGAGKQVTDPKGNVTTTYYQVFDAPKDDAVTQFQSGGITQTIGRDLYGNPLSLTQSGLYGTESDSTTKTLTYDSYHRLCRTTEPESGSTVMAYDGANNLAWSADGVAVTGSGCGQEQVAAAAQTTRTYDALNRLKTLVPPSGAQSTLYGYDAAGRLTSAASGITSWAAAYNYRGLVTGESLQLTGQSAWGLGYAHDAYGNVTLIHYPTGENVSYAPDALGRATQVGSYANTISYFPNGEVAQFLYGNGSSYVATQNTRQLLSSFSDGQGSTVQLGENLGYDKNANLTTVSDLTGGPRSKSFGYDALDRVTSAQAPNLWGSQAYTYDALNNLRTLQTATQTANYNYDATNRLTSVTSGATTLSSFLYDNRGNVITRNGANLIFDLKNQLTQIQGHDSYAYDADGRRVQKTLQGGTPASYFYSHAGQLMYSSNPSSDGGVNYIYLGKHLLARDTLARPAPPSAPTLTAPTSNTTGSYVVSWSAVSSATSYTLQEKVGSGAWATVQNAASLSWTASGRATGSYSYQVQACNSFGCGPWSTTSTVVVTLPPATAPTLTLSASNMVSASPVSYSVGWTTVASATTYILQEKVGTGAWATVQSTAGTSWSASGGTTGSYSYQVQACNGGGCGPWSTVGTVTVTTPPTSAPSLIMPTASPTGTYGVSWTTVTGASSYTLQEKVGSGTWTTVQATSAVRWSTSGRAVGSYGYQVQACNAAGCGPWAATTTLTVYAPPAISAIATYQSTSLSWTNIPGAVYTVQESFNSGSWTNLLQNTPNVNWGADGNAVGAYSFRVQACDSSGCGGWSNTAAVTTTAKPPVPSLSVLGNYQSISWSWTSIAGTKTYNLQQSFNGGAYTTIQNTNNVNGGSSNNPIGTYSFRVQACSSTTTCGPWSNVVTITTTATPTVPALSIIGSYQSFSWSWTSIPGTKTYDLQQSFNGGTWTTIQNTNNVNGGSSNNPVGTYSFRVQACTSSGCGAWSNTVTVKSTAVSQVMLPARSLIGMPHAPGGDLALYGDRDRPVRCVGRSREAGGSQVSQACLTAIKEAA